MRVLFAVALYFVVGLVLVRLLGMGDPRDHVFTGGVVFFWPVFVTLNILGRLAA